MAGDTDSTEATFPVTVGPDLTYNGGAGDAFVAKVSADGMGLVYAGYVGGSGVDAALGAAVDGDGNVYVTGLTNSTEATFPATVGPDLTYNGGSSDAIVVKIGANQPPVAQCKDVTVSAGPSCAANASIDDGSFDPDGDPFTCTQSPPGPYALGTTNVTLTCTDSGDLSSSCSGVVTVADTEGPVVTTKVVTLWPPNHGYRQVSLAACVTSIVDACAGPLSLWKAKATITRVTSDEPDDGHGDGHTHHDMIITGPKTVKLRAERQGGGNGRVYTIDFNVRDPSGNITSASCHVQVPPFPWGTAIDDGPASCVGAGCGQIPCP